MEKIEKLRKDLCVLCGELMKDFNKSLKDATKFTESSIESLLSKLR